MSEKLTIQTLTSLLASKHKMSEQDAEAFVKEFFLLIEQALENDKCVKIKGLGTFKLIEVDNRESVNINTKERFEIKGHNKISFIPDSSLKEIINKPFSHFETVILNENTILKDTPLEEPDEENTKNDEMFANEETKNSAINTQTDIENDEKKETKESTLTQSQEPITPSSSKGNGEHELPEKMPHKQSIPIKELDSTKERPMVSYIIALILIVLLLCGGTVLFLYYPDLFHSTPKGNTLDFPTSIEMGDSIQESDTIAATPEKVEDTSRLTNKQDSIYPNARAITTNKNNVRPLSESVKYVATGTKDTHTVKEGETLIKIALEYYGNKAMWPYIVKYNKDVIKNPDNVPYGTVIKIPELEEAQ